MDGYQYFFDGDGQPDRLRGGRPHALGREAVPPALALRGLRPLLAAATRTMTEAVRSQQGGVLPGQHRRRRPHRPRRRSGSRRTPTSSTSCGDYSSLSIREVLAAGWGDTYTQYRAGQSFDLTRPAERHLLHRGHRQPGEPPGRVLADNNVALRKIQLSGKPGARKVTRPAGRHHRRGGVRRHRLSRSRSRGMAGRPDPQVAAAHAGRRRRDPRRTGRAADRTVPQAPRSAGRGAPAAATASTGRRRARRSARAASLRGRRRSGTSAGRHRAPAATHSRRIRRGPPRHPACTAPCRRAGRRPSGLPAASRDRPPTVTRTSEREPARPVARSGGEQATTRRRRPRTRRPTDLAAEIACRLRRRSSQPGPARSTAARRGRPASSMPSIGGVGGAALRVERRRGTAAARRPGRGQAGRLARSQVRADASPSGMPPARPAPGPSERRPATTMPRTSQRRPATAWPAARRSPRRPSDRQASGSSRAPGRGDVAPGPAPGSAGTSRQRGDRSAPTQPRWPAPGATPDSADVQPPPRAARPSPSPEVR